VGEELGQGKAGCRARRRLSTNAAAGVLQVVLVLLLLLLLLVLVLGVHSVVCFGTVGVVRVVASFAAPEKRDGRGRGKKYGKRRRSRAHDRHTTKAPENTQSTNGPWQRRMREGKRKPACYMHEGPG